MRRYRGSIQIIGDSELASDVGKQLSRFSLVTRVKTVEDAVDADAYIAVFQRFDFQSISSFIEQSEKINGPVLPIIWRLPSLLVGPFVRGRNGAGCLRCYFKRRLQHSVNAQVEMALRTPQQAKVGHSPVLPFLGTYAAAFALSMLGHEGGHSGYYTLAASSLEVVKSEVLPVHGCGICAPALLDEKRRSSDLPDEIFESAS